MEFFVYIHGVVSDLERRSDHSVEYRTLHEGISGELVARGHQPLPPFEEAVGVEWGFDVSRAGDTAHLARAQRVIWEGVDAATPRDLTGLGSLLFAPAVGPVRDLVAIAWADLAYYISEHGKGLVRSLIWQEIISRVGADVPADLTVVGHSAGSLIAHDFLFWLFSGDRDQSTAPGLTGDLLDAARANWRLRRLVTLGSPLAPLAVRSPAVAALLAGGTRIDSEKIGLGRPDHFGREPVWLNVWDRHDALSYPVAPFYEGRNVVDLYPDHSDSLLSSHNAYWTSARVHRILADNWY